MQVSFFAGIRDITGCASVEIPWDEIPGNEIPVDDAPDAGALEKTALEKTAGDLARALCLRYGDKLKQKLFDSFNSMEEFNRELIILINRRHVNFLGGPKATLKPDDRVDIFSVVSGG